MKKGIFIFVLLAFICVTALSQGKRAESFAPENDLWIAADDKEASGINEKEFNDVIEKIENIYKPIVAAKGGKLVIQRKWMDGTVNAYASRFSTTWNVAMFGGLARYNGMTPDGFSLVVCHELAHHLGGAPKASYWASNEGQSDYIGTMKCLREVFKADNNQALVEKTSIDPFVKDKCEEAYSDNDEQAAMCMRIAMAGKVLAEVLKDLGKQDPISFSTPDQRIVNQTDNTHPKAQCRLDTYLQGALCDKDNSQPVSDTDVLKGTCNTSQGDQKGTRPLCWFKP